MTTSAAPSLRRLTPQAAVLLLVAAVAWLVAAGRTGTMVGMTGTMGLSLPAFVGMWGLMMAAMMLPSVAPMYQRSVRSYRALRLAGSPAVPAGLGRAGIPAFLLTALVARLVDDHPGWATAVAVVVFAACGVYQLTPLKSRCLKHCRSPLSLLLHYGAYRGAAGCARRHPSRGVLPWLLLVADGAVRGGGRDEPGRHGGAGRGRAGREVVRGELLARVVGVAALVLAVAVLWVAALAPGLHGTSQMMAMAGS